MTADQLEEYRMMCECPQVQQGKPRGYERFWLPSQEQIQDMIHRFTCDFRLMQDCYYWCAKTRQADLPRIKDKSFEQLWLQFFMWREHEMVWTKDMRWCNERAYGVVV